MNKNISKNPFLQALFSIKCQSTLQMLDFHLYLSTKYTSVFVRQTVLGSVAGVRREAANIKSRQLHEMNLVQKVYNEWTSCNYKINPLFYVYAEELKHIFPALKIICRKRLLSAFLCASFMNRTPILEEEDYFNNPSITMIEKKKQKLSGCIRESFRGVKNKFLRRNEEKNPSKEGIGMMQPAHMVISPTLQRITKGLCLSKAGQLKLLVFPEQALIATFEEFNRRRGLKEPFFWFITYAKGYCIQNNLHVDYDLWHILCKKYNVDDSMPFTQTQQPKTPVYTPSIVEEVVLDRKAEAQKYKQAVLEGKPHPAWAHYPLPGTQE